ncbi:MAG: rhodanese-like domain-containing protein [Verrucomicrobiota bacterium]|nr:rhodanese-like domain-containing protein [Verrucomicrobiota bacterium]
MPLVFERFQTEGIAELSYLLGDDDEGIAAVFDPTPDVDKYIELAREKNVSITHVFETHIHADLVSGARELCARFESAKIFVSHEAGAKYGFETEKLHDGDTFAFGDTIVTVRHTPGHTPEHISFEMAESETPKKPWGVLTGDSLFVNSAGRPDLLGNSMTKQLAAQQFKTLREYFLGLPDSVMIHPGHGAGSPCGADIGDRLQSTIGYERSTNPFLQFDDVEKFTDFAIKTAPPVPTYYPRMKKINAEGPEIIGNLPKVAALPTKAFKKAIDEKKGVLVDTRSMLAFGGGHIPGALNIGGSPSLSIWAGWLLDPAQPILLVLEKDNGLEDVLKLFIRTGYTKFAGYLVGGIQAWEAEGFLLEQIPQLSVHEIQKNGSGLQLVDVRGPGEWKKGHIPGAQHFFLPQLREKSLALDKSKPTAVYCASGYRASLGASILKQEGFTDVRNVPGSWHAWKKAGFPVEK